MNLHIKKYLLKELDKQALISPSTPIQILLNKFMEFRVPGGYPGFYSWAGLTNCPSPYRLRLKRTVGLIDITGRRYSFNTVEEVIQSPKYTKELLIDLIKHYL